MTSHKHKERADENTIETLNQKEDDNSDSQSNDGSDNTSTFSPLEKPKRYDVLIKVRFFCA